MNLVSSGKADVSVAMRKETWVALCHIFTNEASASHSQILAKEVSPQVTPDPVREAMGRAWGGFVATLFPT